MSSKRLTIGTLLAGIFAIVYGGQALAVISGSKHDFSAKGYGTTEICIVCHTPHNADTTVADAPLWNHEQSAVATYTIYTSFSLDGAPGQPSGSSKLCLSCHDGTVAVENFGGTTTGTKFVGGSKNLGTSLADDHPVSIEYTAATATADGELADPTVAPVLPLVFNAKVECASCHDVHDKAGNGFLLTVANNGSALCLTCHTK